MFVLVFVSRDFELGRNISYEVLTVSLHMGLIYFIMLLPPKSVSAKALYFQAVCLPHSFVQTDLVTTISHELLELF